MNRVFLYWRIYRAVATDVKNVTDQQLSVDSHGNRMNGNWQDNINMMSLEKIIQLGNTILLNDQLRTLNFFCL